MRQTRAVELGTGLFVFLGVAALFFLTTQTVNVETLVGSDGYLVTARFDNIGGLKVKAPVQMAGVTIGRVESIRLDNDTLTALVSMRIRGAYDQIPDDSDAAILTAGLLGANFVGFTPGGSDVYLEDGSELLFTQSAVVLENLISKYLFQQATEGEDTTEE